MVDEFTNKAHAQTQAGNELMEPTTSPPPLSDRAKVLSDKIISPPQLSNKVPSVKVMTNSNHEKPPHTQLSKKISLRMVPKKKKMPEFADRLYDYQKICFDKTIADCQDYFLEESWEDVMSNNKSMTQNMRLQQQALWEFLTTERNYIKKLRIVVQVFQQSFRIIQSQGDLAEIKHENIFGNINEVLLANDQLWTSHMIPVINEARKTRNRIKPTTLLASFYKVDEFFQPYVNFCLKQDACLEYLRELTEVQETKRSEKNKNFTEYLKWCQSLPHAQRYILRDLLTEPMQRITRYPLLLKKITKGTKNEKEKEQLHILLKKVEEFISNINKTLRKKFEREKLDKCLNQFEYYTTMQAANEEVKWTAIDFLRVDIQNLATKEQRCVLKNGPMKLIEKKARNETNVEGFLFTDIFLMARHKKSASTFRLIRQLFHLDKVKLIKSEVSDNCIVFIYLDEFGLLQTTFLLEVNENERDVWVAAIEKAKRRYQSAKNGRGSTLDFFQDANTTVTDTEVKVLSPSHSTVSNTSIFDKPQNDGALNADHNGRSSDTPNDINRDMSSQPPFETIPENHIASWVLDSHKNSQLGVDCIPNGNRLGDSFRSHKSESDAINNSSSGRQLRKCNSVPEIANLDNINEITHRETSLINENKKSERATTPTNLSSGSESSGTFQTSNENNNHNNNKNNGLKSDKALTSNTRHLIHEAVAVNSFHSNKKQFVSVYTQTDDHSQRTEEKRSTEVAASYRIDMQEQQQQQTNISFSTSMFHKENDEYDDVVIQPRNGIDVTNNDSYYAENYLDNI